jgi:hypothetical protein
MRDDCLFDVSFLSNISVYASFLAITVPVTWYSTSCAHILLVISLLGAFLEPVWSQSKLSSRC